MSVIYKNSVYRVKNLGWLDLGALDISKIDDIIGLNKLDKLRRLEINGNHIKKI